MEDAGSKVGKRRRADRLGEIGDIPRQFEVDRMSEALLAQAYELILPANFRVCGSVPRRRPEPSFSPQNLQSTHGG